MTMNLLLDLEAADDLDLELRSRKTTAPHRSSARYNTARRYAKRRGNSTRAGINRRANKFSRS